MFDRYRRLALTALRVPPEPAPPLGAPASLRVFRAGRNFYKLRLLRWAFGQAGAAAGLGVSLYFFGWFKTGVEAAWREPAPAATISSAPTPAAPGPAPRAKARRPSPERFVARSAAKLRPWMLTLFTVIEGGAAVAFLAQLPFTLALVRLEYEQHWYLVTDRSLRIRTGLVVIREATMSFANLQQVEVRQGPLQRLLGLADVRVQSAGGGDGSGRHDGAAASPDDALHTGVFHGVEHAETIRDLILERLRLFRQAGLGDPDDVAAPPAGAAAGALPAAPGDLLTAAHEALAEARALRAAAGAPS